MIKERQLQALEMFCSDYNDLDGTISDIRFASAKHFEDFAEDEREEMIRIVYAVFSGLQTCRDIHAF